MSSRITRHPLCFFSLALITGLLVVGCGGSDTSSSTTSGGSLTLYSSQHEPMTEALVAGFEAENGAKVEVRYGEDEGLASQIEQEGDASPADVFLAENTPPLELLAGDELLAEVDSSTLDEVPSQYNSPTGHWVGVAARETVMVYNPDLVAADELPASILDLAKPDSARPPLLDAPLGSLDGRYRSAVAPLVAICKVRASMTCCGPSWPKAGVASSKVTQATWPKGRGAIVRAS